MINLDLSITVHACCFALGIIITIACLSLPANIASPVKLQQLYFSFPSFCHHLTCYSSIKEHFSGAFIDIFIIFQTFTAFRELLRICTKTNGVNSPHLLMYGIFPSLFKLWPVSIYAELEGNAPTQMQTYLICWYMHHIYVSYHICIIHLCMNMSVFIHVCFIFKSAAL